ncbi:SWPV1-135 [Shearwaterpox virus]|uniref:SWPV1-135 n=1 Tax=Shearwaterpox virus TaxID=1974596 RepID=A0A1V0QGZ7_CNPV|nr:SWPV1-135 [Shearwaterpox virus]
MGIKNLKSVLLYKHRLRNLDSAIKTEEIYVDFLGLFMAIAYSVTSTDMLYMIIRDKFKFINSIAKKVVVFVDRGSISLKTALREKRKQSLKNQYIRKKEEIKHLEEAINNLSVYDDLYEEQKESMSSKIDKNNYYMFLSDKKNIEPIIENVLISLDNIEIYYCDHIDAEFVMCCKAREYYLINGSWPAILSSDQDTMCLACVDLEEKIIYDTKTVYRLSPDKYTQYLTKLIVLVNGCDFFRGLHGISITKDNCTKYELFKEFTKDNVLRSLVYKNYSLKADIDTSVIDDIDKIFDFINYYTSLNDKAYDVKELPTISAKEFISSIINQKWEDIKKNYNFDNNILQNIYNVYKKNSQVDEEQETTALRMIECYRFKEIKLKTIKSFIVQLGLKCTDKISTIGISSSGDLYMGLEGRFYFNPRAIIENSTKMINININIYS